MQQYQNKGGNSGVRAFELGVESITVQFSDGATYLYTVASAGAHVIEEMTKLALTGVGLNSYISRVVKTGYEAKIR